MEERAVADSVGELVDIGGGRTIEIRPTTADDAELILGLYDALSLEDRYRRFFGAFRPDAAWCREWASVGERGGFGVIALVHGAGRQIVAGEAGYAMRRDGDGDLAVTVAPEWRGWLGSYLVDLVVRHAAASGIANLQAEVLLENRPMLAILHRRGPVNLEHSPGVVRLSIGTGTGPPSWPPQAEGRKLLVTTPGGRWVGEEAAARAGCVTAMCSGPAYRRRGGCPVLRGERCPLADHADAIVILLDPDDEQTRQLVALHRQRRPGVPIFVARPSDESDSVPDECLEIPASGDDAVARVLSLIGPVPDSGGRGSARSTTG